MKSLTLILAFFTIFASAQNKSHLIVSPDKKITVAIEISDRVYYSIKHEGDVMVGKSYSALRILDDSPLGVNPMLKSVKTRTVTEQLNTPIYKRNRVDNNYNEIVLTFRDNYAITFRAYNDGVAYRFNTTRKKDLLIESEETVFKFENNPMVFLPYVNKPDGASFEDQLWNSFENTYSRVKLASANANKLAFLPVLVESTENKKVCITEADLEEYPGMYLVNKGVGDQFNAFFAGYPQRTKQGGHNELQQIVTAREPFIAKVKGTRSFPWRVLIVTAEDKDLLNTDMVYKLGAPSRIEDPSWIKPGKVAWDWWNDWNIDGVDFKTGVNTETYKHYIDFAAENKIEYVILDEGWAVNLKVDLMQIAPEIDLKGIINYAAGKGVGIILWAGYNAFNKDIEGVCRHYAEMGVKGFKVDFMDRDDQEMVSFYYRAASIAAKYKLLLDYHGAFKPTGMQRTYPNVINFEGVHGLEQMKWSPPSVDQVTYDVTIPFIRMVAGPLDYTQGAMRNATKDNYRPVNSEPMSQGTRCRQLAEYVVFEAPLNMMCDHPSNYRREMECTRFISAIPTIWDNTLPLSGKVAEFVCTARKKDDAWYVGGMTNWEEREYGLDLAFLGTGKYEMELFTDGVNAARAARDYRREVIEVEAGQVVKIKMAPGGGFAAILKRK